MKTPPIPEDLLRLGTALRKPTDFFELAKIYGGVPFLGSMPGSPASRSRLRRGDIVLAVNGKPTPDVDAFLEARQLRSDGATIRFVRDGVEDEVELVWSEAAVAPRAQSPSSASTEAN